MPADPTQVDANWQIQNLPTPPGSDNHWQQFAPWYLAPGVYNDLDITAIGGLSPGLVPPTVPINANVPRPRILYIVGDGADSILTGIDTSIPGVPDYPFFVTSFYGVYNVGGGILLANQYGIYADNYGTAISPAGSAGSNLLNIAGCLPPFSAIVNLNNTNTVTVTSVPDNFPIRASMLVVGTGIPSKTLVTHVSGSTLTLSASATITATGATIYLVDVALLDNGRTAIMIPIPQGSRGGGSPLAYGGWNVAMIGGQDGPYF